MNAPTFQEIVMMVRSRQMANSDKLNAMIEVRRRYNADWVLPVPTDHDGPELPPVTALIIAEAIEFHANQAAGPYPISRFPALEWKDTGQGSIDHAVRRRRACGAVMTESLGKLLMRRSYRHLSGYATSSILVVPDFKSEMPRVMLRDPLTTYPELKAPEDLSRPANVAYVFPLTAANIRARYPQARAENGGPVSDKMIGHEIYDGWDVVEWNDEHEIVTGLMGPHNWTHVSGSAYEAAQQVDTQLEISRIPNRCGMCTGYTMERVTLDRIASQISNITGHVDLLARLTALNIMATEKSIFKDKYVIGKEGATPRLVDGQWHDGRTGLINIIQDANAVGELTATPDPNNRATIDALERNARVSIGLIPQAGGENSGSLRTGRANDSMLAISVDPRTRELQEIMEPALTFVNEAILETYRSYWPDKKYTMFSGWAGDYTTFNFHPRKHIDTVKNIVKYPFGGADEQGTTIILGQLHGQGVLSVQSVRERHPWIDDPDAEGKRVDMEQLELAIMQSVQQGAATGALPPAYIAKLLKHRRKEANIIDAIEKCDAEIAKEKAMAPPPMESGMVAPPSPVPGLGAPAMDPAAMPPEGMPPGQVAGEVAPTGNQQGLKHLLSALSTAPPTQGPVQGAPV